MVRKWVDTWKVAGPLLEEIRQREVRDADNLESLAVLEPSFNLAVRMLPLRESSGQVEMQRYFARLRPL